MTDCSALGCRAPATETRRIVMPDGRIVRADYCAADAAVYDTHLARIEADNAWLDRIWPGERMPTFHRRDNA